MGYREIDRVFDRTSDYAGIQVGTSDARAFRLADILRTRAMIGQVSGVLEALIGRLKCSFESSGIGFRLQFGDSDDLMVSQS